MSVLARKVTLFLQDSENALPVSTQVRHGEKYGFNKVISAEGLCTSKPCVWCDSVKAKIAESAAAVAPVYAPMVFDSALTRNAARAEARESAALDAAIEAIEVAEAIQAIEAAEAVEVAEAIETAKEEPAPIHRGRGRAKEEKGDGV